MDAHQAASTQKDRLRFRVEDAKTVLLFRLLRSRLILHTCFCSPRAMSTDAYERFNVHVANELQSGALSLSLGMLGTQRSRSQRIIFARDLIEVLRRHQP